MNYFEGYPSITQIASILEINKDINQNIRQDPLRLEGFLKDLYGSQYKREIFLIVTATKAKINIRLEKAPYLNCPSALLWEIISHLTSVYSLEERSAAWVTIVWALSLKKLSESGVERFITELRSIENRKSRKNVPIFENLNSDLSIFDSKRANNNDINDFTPNSLDMLYEKGNKLHNQGRFSEAIDCYDKALKINPQDHRLLSNKGLSHHNQGRFSEAIDCYDKALKINSGDPYIIRRKEHTIEILQRKNINPIKNQNELHLVNGLSSRKRSLNMYFIGIVITIIILISVIVAYITLESLDKNNQNTQLMLHPNTSSSLIKTNSEESKNTNLTGDKFRQLSLEDFTNTIKKEITVNPANQSLIQFNVPIAKDVTVKTDEANNVFGNHSNLRMDKSVDDFRSELSKAMKTTFN